MSDCQNCKTPLNDTQTYYCQACKDTPDLQLSDAKFTQALLDAIQFDPLKVIPGLETTANSLAFRALALLLGDQMCLTRQLEVRLDNFIGGLDGLVKEAWNAGYEEGKSDAG